jgi:hypothetical protein
MRRTAGESFALALLEMIRAAPTQSIDSNHSHMDLRSPHARDVKSGQKKESAGGQTRFLHREQGPY